MACRIEFSDVFIIVVSYIVLANASMQTFKDTLVLAVNGMSSLPTLYKTADDKNKAI